MFSKTIVVVDKDVNVQDVSEVAWIAGTHVDPQRDIQFTRGPDGRSRERVGPAGVRQQDGDRRHAKVARRRLHARMAHASGDQRCGEAAGRGAAQDDCEGEIAVAVSLDDVAAKVEAGADAVRRRYRRARDRPRHHHAGHAGGVDPAEAARHRRHLRARRRFEIVGGSRRSLGPTSGQRRPGEGGRSPAFRHAPHARHGRLERHHRPRAGRRRSSVRVLPVRAEQAARRVAGGAARVEGGGPGADCAGAAGSPGVAGARARGRDRCGAAAGPADDQRDARAEMDGRVP